MEKFGKYKKEIPLEVARAKFLGNREALSALGKKGGATAGKLSKRRADERAATEVFRTEHENMIRRDAEVHAEETRPGWDDAYTP